MIDKPPELFDRYEEWQALASFAADPALGATLAVVYGRRRQGKTLTLELLAEATGGFMFTGLEQAEPLNLNALGAAYSDHLGLSAPVAFTDWQQALEAVLALGERENPVPVILDELPYLIATSPQLPSMIQSFLSPRGRARLRSRTRLVLCGSAFSVMCRLLSGSAPLRGRAVREVLFHPFGYRDAATFWGIDDPQVAVRVHALCGGTPAYRDFAGADVPRSLDDLDGWVVRNLLNSSSAFFREGRVLLAEEPSVTDLTLYYSVLSILATGRTRRSEVARALGRPDSAMAHPLTMLEKTRLVERREDVLRQKRSTFHIAEPLMRFHQLVIRPYEARLARRGQAARVWAELADTVSAQIYGPHFEQLAREWSAEYAHPRSLGGSASRVGTSEVHCHRHRRTHQLDVVAVENLPGSPSRIMAIGEVKWRGEEMDVGQLERLSHIRELLAPQATSTPLRLLLFGRSGFTKRLLAAVRERSDVELIDLDRLYYGS